MHLIAPAIGRLFIETSEGNLDFKARPSYEVKAKVQSRLHFWLRDQSGTRFFGSGVRVLQKNRARAIGKTKINRKPTFHFSFQWEHRPLNKRCRIAVEGQSQTTVNDEAFGKRKEKRIHKTSLDSFRIRRCVRGCKIRQDCFLQACG